MNWHLIIGITAGVIQVYSIIPYIKDILAKNGTRPNVVSWALWTLLQLIAIAIQVTSADGFSWSLLFLVATTFNTALVVVLCLRGYGSKEIGPTEKTCLMIALVSVMLYLTTEDAALALTFNIVADLVAAWPTIKKTFRDPRSEAWFPWFLVSMAATLAALSSEIRDAENLAFPIYLAAANGLIAALAFRGRNKKNEPVS